MPIKPKLLEDCYNEGSKDHCWLWFGNTTKKGYGRYSAFKQDLRAHIAVYIKFFGSYDKSLILHHTCTNKLCVNPYHMELLTEQEHIFKHQSMAVVNKAKTHCLRGHEFTSGNTRSAKGNRRICRECARLNAQATRTIKTVFNALTN